MKELTYSPEEAENVCIGQSPSFFVSHCHAEVVKPDGGIDSEALTFKIFELDRPGCRLKKRPKSLHTHYDD